MNILRKVDINCGKYELNLGTKTYIMGILNVTPDSFSDGGKFNELDSAIKHAKEMLNDGADIIDIGAESTRPGSEEVTAEEELKRLLPIIEKLVKEVDAPISVDTYKASVAEECIKKGAHMINDVWGLQRDKDMAAVVAKYDVPVTIMHNQIGTEYETDIMEEIFRFLRESIKLALEAGVKPENIILDPGIGFGKTTSQNIEVMNRLDELNYLGYPVLLGTSRKTMIGDILELPPVQRVEGTVATSVMGTIKGVDIVRVHDVVENYRALKVTDAIVRGNMSWIK